MIILEREVIKPLIGADDNASGVAALLVLAKNIEQMPNRQLNYLFLATDAEENGLHGARSFVEKPPIPLSDMILNINLDMLGYSKRKRLLGLYTSQLKPLIEELKQLQWHRGGDVKFTRGNGFFPISIKSQRRRILNASDHKLFHQNAIPILYFGVGEHRFYHTEDDTYDNLHHQFYNANLHNIAKVISLLDANYSQIGTH